MICLEITEIKHFMSCLLSQEVFDNFLLSELQLTVMSQIKISGRRNLDYYSSDEEDTIKESEYVTWGEVRPLVYNIIKGSKTPTKFRIVMLLNKSNTEKTVTSAGVGLNPEEVSGLFININFEKNRLMITNGTALSTFAQNMALENAWGEYVKRFMTHHGISY